jgi:predicted GNAT family N-acyltransferase/RimJ/RimL family protein N-acetyltransferase
VTGPTRSDLIVRAAEPADLDAARALRYAVFVEDQGVPLEVEQDGRDAGARHVVAVRHGTVIGTGRLLEHDGVALVGRMAVAKPDRRAGIGAAMLAELERMAGRQGLTAVELHAQLHAQDFYRRAGYQPVGEPFEEAGIGHRRMRKPLPRVRPATDGDSTALIGLLGDCFAEYPGCVLDVDREEPWLRTPATGYVGGQLWVVTLDDTVVACIGHKPHGETSELKNLYVAASARRGGLGARLTGMVEDVARAAGADRMRLWSDTRFLDAHRLYERLGYRRTGRSRELHDRSATVEFEFAKALSPDPGGTREPMRGTDRPA